MWFKYGLTRTKYANMEHEAICQQLHLPATEYFVWYIWSTEVDYKRLFFRQAEKFLYLKLIWKKASK